jgi:hypothetical protein
VAPTASNALTALSIVSISCRPFGPFSRSVNDRFGLGGRSGVA